MDNYIIPVQVRWSDLDPNFHIRHTVYFEWGAMCRMIFLESLGLTLDKLQELKIGPILFREESLYRKEIRFGDKVTIDLKSTKCKRDYSRWSIRHEIRKESEVLAATISVDIAWMSSVTRRLTKLPADVIPLIENTPKAADFQWLD